MRRARLLDAPRPLPPSAWRVVAAARSSPQNPCLGPRRGEGEASREHGSLANHAQKRNFAFERRPPLGRRSLGACDLAELAGRAGGAEDRHPTWLAREVGTPASLPSTADSALVAAQGRLRRLRTFGFRHFDDTTPHSRRTCARPRLRAEMPLPQKLPAREEEELAVRARVARGKPPRL